MCRPCEDLLDSSFSSVFWTIPYSFYLIVGSNFAAVACYSQDSGVLMLGDSIETYSFCDILMYSA